jgi:hypothetical protein
MKKAILLIGTVVMLGAGCSQQNVSQTPPTSVDTNIDSGSSSPSGVPPLTPQATDGGLTDLPAVDASKAPPMDASTWSKTALHIGLTLTYPTKGLNAPTWTYAFLATDDSHLKGNCYVTDATVYKKTDFTGFDSACLTTTALAAGPGTRTDYFTFNKATTDSTGKAVMRTHLFTFTKTYPAGFDMDGYTATLEKVIGLIQ